MEGSWQLKLGPPKMCKMTASQVLGHDFMLHQANKAPKSPRCSGIALMKVRPPLQPMMPSSGQTREHETPNGKTKRSSGENSHGELKTRHRQHDRGRHDQLERTGKRDRQ